jgi:hypothetical protein
MRESAQQRNSRIANDDTGAHSAFGHAQDFFSGLATYSIKPTIGGFSVCEMTPRGQVSGWAKTQAKAEAMVQEWKNKQVKNGYTK